MSNRYAAALFFLVFIFLSGCVLQDIFGREEPATVTKTQVSGVVVDFLDSSPPDLVLQNRDFKIEPLVENRGDYAIKKGEITVTADGEFVLSQGGSLGWTNTEPLIAGYQGEAMDQAIITSYPPVKYISGLLGDTAGKLAVKATACYTYETRVRGEACVGATVDSKLCTDKGDKLINNTGAPIQVTAIQQKSFGDTINLDFAIERLAKGQVWSLDSDSCSGDGELFLGVKSVTLGGNDISRNCVREAKPNRQTKTDVISCKDIPVSVSTAALVKNIEMVLRYRYSVEGSKLVTVEAA